MPDGVTVELLGKYSSSTIPGAAVEETNTGGL
jgi:hypothetical protein